MTLVDLFAWLKAIQHEYMSVIVPESQRRFLALLGIEQRRGCGSATLVELGGTESVLALPAETKWTAGEMVFENPSTAFVQPARLKQVCFSGGGRTCRADPADFDGTRIFEIFPGMGPEPAREPDGEMILILSDPVAPGTELSLYFDICPDGPAADAGWARRTVYAHGRYWMGCLDGSGLAAGGSRPRRHARVPVSRHCCFAPRH